MVKIKIRVVVASVASLLERVATFFATRHPILAFEAGKATLVAIGGLIGTGGTVAIQKIRKKIKTKNHK